MKETMVCGRARRGWLGRSALVVAAMLAASGLWADSLTNGLRSWYRLDGDATDSSGNGLHGTIYGSPQFVAGTLGQGVKLNKDLGEWIDIGPDAPLTNLTFAAWVRADGVTWDGAAWDLPIISDNGPGEVFLGIRGTGKFRGGCAGSYTMYSSTVVETGRFYRVALTVETGGAARLYVNGLLEASTNVGTRNLSGPDTVRLGCDRPELMLFNGVIDDARIYDRALSAVEVANLGGWVSISGTVTWTGAVEGVVRVYAGGGPGETDFGAELAVPGAFGISNIFSGDAYWVWAYMDRDGDGVHEVGEPTGVWSGSPVLLTNDLSGVAITLGDSDVDADGMPDWWEIKYGLNPLSGGPGVGVFGGYASFVGYDRGEALTNFPALLVLGTNIPGFSCRNFASPQGWDLRITESNATQELPYEIEEWNTNGNSYLWVKLPYLTTNGSPLWLSWGSNLAQAAYTTNGSVWSDGFVSVHHMGGTNAASTPDSRGSYTGTMNNMEVGDRGVGVAGRALSFDGVDEYVSLPNGYSNFSSGMTISLWARPTTNVSQQRFVEFGVGAQDHTISLLANADSEFGYEIYENSSTNPNLTAGSLTTGQWQQFVVTHSSGGKVRVFKDGFSVGTRDCALPSAATRIMNQFARRGAGASPYYQGALDEVRVESVARSANWVWAAWMNQASNDSFVGWAVDQGGAGMDTDGDGLTDLEEYQRDLNPTQKDTDNDGMPDGWEVANGLDPKVHDSLLDPDGDGLSNGGEYAAGSRPTGAGAGDSDGDGLGDLVEWQTHGTNPAVADSDGDGMRDDWEVANGTNPNLADGNQDRDLDGLSNIEEWNLRAEGYLANRADSDGDGKSDYENAFGKSPVGYHYDRNDRLTGAEYNRGSNGFSIAYFYDGNGNIVRQVYTGRDDDGDGISDWREVRDGLSTTNSDAYADSDGDGWSNWQEIKAGSNPNDPNSTPNALGPSGTVVASWLLGFNPSNFVMASGQLDGIGAEEIVVGADGQPGALTNSLLVLSQGATNWTSQQVAIGPVGITSIAVGQPTNRSQAAIYVGTRDPGGAAGLQEIFRSNATWSVNAISVGTSGQVVRVLGVGPARHLIVESPLSGSPGVMLRSLAMTGGVWSATALSSSTNSRGPGYTALPIKSNQASIGLRPVDPEGIEAFSDGWTPVASVLSWSFDDGTATDVSGHGLHGTAYGVITNARGMSFDGTIGDYIVRPNFVHPDTAFTVALWLRTSLMTGQEQYFYSYAVPGQDNELVVGIVGASVRAEIKGQQVFNSPCAIADGQWHHLAVTWTSSGGQLKLWKDGLVVFATNVLSGTTIASGGSLVLGQEQDSVGGGFDVAQAYLGDMDDFRVDSRVLSDNEILSLAGLAVPSIIEEPLAVSRQLWQSQIFGSGNVRTNTAPSGFYAFVNDKNASGLGDAGDEFVVSEFKLDGSTNARIGERRISMPGAVPGMAYGLACADLIGSAADVFFTGEAGGLVYSWVATNGTGPLERTLFSSQHHGKQWHQLGALGGLSGGEGLVGLLVDSAAPSSCKVVLWEPMGSLPRIPEPLQTAPVARCEAVTNTVGSLPTLAVRFWDGEGNASYLEVQYSTDGGATWHTATIHMIDGDAGLIGQPLGALPGGQTHQVLWRSREDLGLGFLGTVLLRTRARDAQLTGVWSAPVPYSVNATGVADLGVELVDSPDPVGRGGELTYVATVRNLGTDAAYDAQLTGAVPGGCDFLSVAASQGTANESGGTITANLGIVPVGGAPTVTIRVRPTVAGVLSNSVGVSHSGSDPVSGNNTADAGTVVEERGILSVTPPTLELGFAGIGGNAQAAFAVSNVGPGSIAGTVALSGPPFSIVGSSNFTLAGFAGTALTVRFAPTAIGVANGEAWFSSNVGGMTNALRGEGVTAPVALFAADPTNGLAPLLVAFADESSGHITNRLWSFGDGGTLQTLETNVAYTYHLGGSNVVTLTVMGAGGSGTLSRTNYVVVRGLPPGDVNGDGHVNGADALLIDQVLAALRSTNSGAFGQGAFANGDVNQDGAVNGADSMLIDQVMVRLRAYLVTRMAPPFRGTNAPLPAVVYGVGFPTGGVTGAQIGPPVNLGLSNVTAIAPEEIRVTVPAGGGSGTGMVSVTASPSNGAMSSATFENP